MITTKRFRRAFLLLLLPFLYFSSENVFAQNAGDEDAPEVTARTARISFLNGDAQIKRADSQDWERAVKNLPVVEGDEIVTENGARLEIQFDSTDYVRLSPNAYLKITTLRDEGIALSLPNGTMSARVLSFDKNRSYFEIDAPGTTVSVERAGLYRLDAGNQNDSQVRVAVTDSGQARIYSENSGFTLKDGRSATIRLNGDNAGEWQTAAAARYADEFDSWILERDAQIAKRLRDADYDKYYDRDFYGAEDLSGYGEWITRKNTATSGNRIAVRLPIIRIGRRIVTGSGVGFRHTAGLGSMTNLGVMRLTITDAGFTKTMTGIGLPIRSIADSAVGGDRR